MDLLQALRDRLPQPCTLAQAVDAFQAISRLPLDCEPDMLLFETGTFSFIGNKKFCFSLVRQFQTPENGDEYSQLHLNLLYPPSKETGKMEGCLWSDESDKPEDFWSAVRGSAAYQLLAGRELPQVQIYLDET